MYADDPASEIPPSACREIINGTAYTDTMRAREGMYGIYGLEIPTTAVFAASKTGSTVTLTGHTASAANVGSLIVYNLTDDPDEITGISGGAGGYTVVSSTALANGSTTAVVRPKVFGHLQHKKNDQYIVHLGQKLYRVDNSTYVWTEIVQSGAYIIPNQKSRIRELDLNAIVFCNGIFKLDLVLNVYWKTNLEPATNAMTNATYPLTGNFRRYLYSMTKQKNLVPATYPPLFNDRSSNTLMQETGSNQMNTVGIDYAEAYTGPIVPAGDLTTTYNILKTDTVASTSGLTGNNLFFDITVDGVLYTIAYSVVSTASFLQIAAAIQAVMRLEITSTIYVTWSAASQFWFRNIAPSSTISLLTPPTASTGFTDVSSTLQGLGQSGTPADHAAVSSTTYYQQPELKGLVPNTYWKAYTHYSMYVTRQLFKEQGNITGNPSAYAWMIDYPIMRALKVSINGTACTVTTGKLQAYDYGQVVTVTETSGNFASKQVKISAFLTATTATLDTSFSNASYWMFIGCNDAIVFTPASGTLTITNFLTVANSASDTFDALGTAWSAAVGDPIFCQDGNVYYVTEVVSASSVKINNTTISGAATLGCVIPKTFTSGLYATVLKDQTTDATISSRIGTLGLRTRFYRAIADVTTGITIPGFVVSALTNKYYWNDIGTDRPYLIGNNHPTFQVDTLGDDINGFSINQDLLSFYTATNTSACKTNLNIEFTDLNNGNVTTTLPKPVIVDMYLGATSDNHIYDYEGNKVFVLNQDYGIRTFNGMEYSQNYNFKKIQLALKSFAYLLICYDEQYGAVIFGSNDSTKYTACYVLGIREDKFVGCAKFENIAMPSINVQPVLLAGRMLFFGYGNIPVTTGSAVVRFIDGRGHRFYTGTLRDVKASNATGTYNVIPWSFTTGDDVSPGGQSQKIRHLESHLYVAGLLTVDMVVEAITITATAYSDIGVSVTSTTGIKTYALYDGDVNFDKKIEGHKLRFKFAFSNAACVVTGMDSYYLDLDRASSPDTRINTETTYQNTLIAPMLWLSRFCDFINGASGVKMTQTGTPTRTTGPDGKNTAVVTSSGNVLASYPAATTTTAWLAAFYIYNTGVDHTVFSSAKVTITLTGSTGTLVITGATLTASIVLGSVATWTHIVVVHNVSGGIDIYQDNVYVAASAGKVVSITDIITAADLVTFGGAGTMYDVRVFAALAYDSATWAYYLADIASGGNNTGPIA